MLLEAEAVVVLNGRLELLLELVDRHVLRQQKRVCG